MVLFVHHIAGRELFNLLLCELALLGGPAAEPISSLYVALASVVSDHALVNSGGWSGQVNLDRAITGALNDLWDNRWDSWPTADETLVDRALRLTMATRLRSASTALPTLVASAYSHYAFGQTAEAHADSSIATEAIIGSIWREYVATHSGTRKKRLEDSKTYSFSVRLEVLLTLGLISRDLYDAAHLSNRPRNSLVHDAVVDPDSARVSMTTMSAAVAFLCGADVAEPQAASREGW